ncbi:Conserved_hypothetical protein [Hexamita inflata]|uniref:Uncharacterized protein n=1 Tax=Hexamita inflata TaxID=28002 RepID=A0AA86NHE3_9EUKA|nr:Conserved hypothetical protein [Hexamita inflata]
MEGESSYSDKLQGIFDDQYSSYFTYPDEESDNYQICDIVQLSSVMITSLVKIDEGTFLFIKRKQYYIINKQLKVLSVEPYNFSRPIKCLKHNNTNLILTEDSILQIKGNQLVEKLKIFLATDIYSNGNNLFVLREEKLYQMNNSKLKLVYQNAYSVFNQFYDKVYTINKNALFRIYENNQKLKIKNNINEILYQCGSILFILNKNTFIEVFDMINEQFSLQPLNTADFYQYIKNDTASLELGLYGLKLKDKILEQHFGSNYSDEVDNYYNNYQQRSSIETVNSQIEKPKKLEKCQLMHVFKPLPYVDLYTAIEDNLLFIVDKEFNILSQSPINCEIYSGYENKTDGIIRIYEGYQHQLIPCCGKLYIQIRDKVYVLSNQQFKCVFEIPDFDDDINSFYCCLFCVNSELYVKSLSDIYVYRNKQLIHVRKDEEWNFQHQHKVYSYEWHHTALNIFEIAAENTKSLILQIHNTGTILFFHNGIVIIELFNDTYVIADLINENLLDYKLDMLQQNDMLQHIILGPSGVQFNNEIIYQYFGENFQIQQKQLYEELIEQQMQFPCYLEEVYKIIPFQLIFQQFNAQFNNCLKQKHESITKLNCKIVNQLQKISEQVNVLINIQNRIAQSWHLFMESELNQ